MLVHINTNATVMELEIHELYKLQEHFQNSEFLKGSFKVYVLICAESTVCILTVVG